MRDRTILLVLRERAESRRMAAALRATGSEVIVCDSAGPALDVLSTRAVDLVMMEYSISAELFGILDVSAGQIPVVALAKHLSPTVLFDAVCENGIDHFVAFHDSDGQLDATNAVITAEKILRNDVFGIEKYLPTYGVEIHEAQIRCAAARDEVVAAISQYVQELGGGRELAANAANIADELITNAVYNAPRDSHGLPKYAAISRREKISLLPDEYVTVRFASDGKTLTLSVSDQFGSLTHQRLREGFTRCFTQTNQIEQKAGGAGIGLYTSLCSTSQLIFNIAEGECTEVIATFDLAKRMKGIRSGGHSLHIFTQNDAPTTALETPAEMPYHELTLWENLGQIERYPNHYSRLDTDTGSIVIVADEWHNESTLA